jgi:hypothetical protein
VVVTARSAGRAIVEAAIERRSDVIVLGSQGKRRIADKVFGRTIDYVLNNLPCEAIINVIPKTTVTAVAGATVESAGMIPPTVVPPDAVTAGSREALRVADDAARPGAVKRRAHGLPLSRYLPSRPGSRGAASGGKDDEPGPDREDGGSGAA